MATVLNRSGNRLDRGPTRTTSWPPAWMQQPVSPHQSDDADSAEPNFSASFGPAEPTPAQEPQDGLCGPDLWGSAIPIDDVEPCPQCGGLEAWWTFKGEQRCLRCNPPTKSRRLIEKATGLRRIADRRSKKWVP